MASIRQRSGVWQARVRRKGYPGEVNSFKTKSEAQIWARSIESSMDQGGHQSAHQARELLLSDILQRYMQEMTPSKRGAKREAEGILFMLRQKIAAYSMANLTPAAVAGYRDERLKSVGAGTITALMNSGVACAGTSILANGMIFLLYGCKTSSAPLGCPSNLNFASTASSR